MEEQGVIQTSGDSDSEQPYPDETHCQRTGGIWAVPHTGGRLTEEDEKIIDQAVAYMELKEFEDRFIDELSGGQRQRHTLPW
mgnify:FL=1